MKNKIGLLGGMGPESTLVYYKELNRLYLEAVGRKEFPEFTIESVDVWKVLELEGNEEKLGELVDYFVERIKYLQASKCNIAAFTAVTPHLVFHEVKEKSPLPLISVIDTGAKYAKEKGHQRVALLGTIFTMNHDFVQKGFMQEGIEVITPNEKEKNYIHQKLCDEVELGIVTQDCIQGMKKIADRLILEEKVDGIILGCTELPLVFEYIDLPVEKLDMMKIHIDALSKIMLEKDE